MTVRIALAQWQIGKPADFDAFAGRVAAALADAARRGAEVAVLPEYLALELSASFVAEVRNDFARSLASLQTLHDSWLTLFAALARAHGMIVVAGTFAQAMSSGRFRNRAYLFTPNGTSGFQDKLTLTGYERAAGVFEPGEALKVFQTGIGRIAINVCYDSEFPLYAHVQAQAGAQLLLVPSCTDTDAGATRVRVGCMARALENQMYVAQAVTAGAAPWIPALDVNTGAAAVYAPSDYGLPASGIVAVAASGEEWLIADLDFAALETVRQSGQVANAADWAVQLRPAIATSRVEELT